MSYYLFIYLLNTQLVQDIIKTCIHTEMRKKDIKHIYEDIYLHFFIFPFIPTGVQ